MTPAPLKILMAENSPTDGLLMAKRIRSKLIDRVRLNIEIVIVPTLAEALAQADTANVTLLDLNLNDAGPEEVRAAIPRFRSPVIVVTGDDDPATRVACIQAGADFVFIKADLFGLVVAVTNGLLKDIINQPASE